MTPPLLIARPACFERPPATQDSFFRYDEFGAFSLPSQALNHPWELHLPRELVSHDVNEEDWCAILDLDCSTVGAD